MSDPSATGEEGTRDGAAPRAFGFVVGIAIVIAAVVVAIASCRQATIDWKYQLAGLANPFLGHPAPGWSIGWNLAWSIVFIVAAWMIRKLARDGGAWAPLRGRLAPRGWWILVALWGGYLAGSLLTSAAGGPERRPGTLRLEVGAPLGLVAETPVTCTTAPGSPGQVVRIAVEAGGVPYLLLANEATGEPNPYPVGGGVEAYDDHQRPGGGIDIPGLPARPEILSTGHGQSGGPDGRGGRFVIESPVSFFDAYFYVPVSSSIEGSSGTAAFTATRRFDLANVNELLANDPWPTTYPLTASWRCDLAAPAPAPAPSLVPGGFDGTLVWPAPVITTGDGVPVELQLSTSSEWAEVEVTGARVADVEQRSSDGPGTAAADGAAFRIEQPVAVTSSGAVTTATYRFRLVGSSAGARIGLTVQGGATGKIAVTLYNLVGGEPVPVVANVSSSADRPSWPIDVEAEWLLEPIAVGRIP